MHQTILFLASQTLLLITLHGAVIGVRCQESREIENLRAFAKLYGYVKYFHPSDEASEARWNRLAVHGAATVRGATNAAELQGALEALFLPIAPTLQVYRTGSLPPAPAVRVSADTSSLVPVAWQHRGVSRGANPSNPTYVSVRLNRRTQVGPYGAGIGNAMQTVDASQLRGREIRLRAFVRTEGGEGGGTAQLWLRVDREGGVVGFFENMQDRPISSAEWEVYEIVGTVDEDAIRIALGVFHVGIGTIWIDDFELSVRGDHGRWEPIPIANPGFEQADTLGQPEGWGTPSRGYDYVLDSEHPHGDSTALLIRIEPDWFTGELFEARPAIGEVIEKELGSGLSVRVPLAVWSDSVGTLPRPEPDAFEELMDNLDAIDVTRLTADDPAVRLADVIIVWNVFQHFYPYSDVVDWDWDAELSRALRAALADETTAQFYDTINRLVAAAQDGHGRVLHRSISRWARMPLALAWIEDSVVVIRAPETPGLAPGDVILSIDGVPAAEAVAKAEQYISGSPQWKRYRALQEVGRGADSTEVALTIRRADSTFSLRVARSRRRQPSERVGEPIRTLEPDVYYVDLTRADWPAISQRLDELAAARGVVFDLRGYPWGNRQLISHLLQEPDTSDAWMRVPRIIYPDFDRLAGWEHRGWGIEPAEPRIAGAVAFLTDGSAISYAESFMSFIEHYQLAEIVGQPTAGTNGNTNRVDLPGAFRLMWTGMRVVKHDGTQHHLIGIQPTIPAARTIQGVRDGRDEVLEKALAAVNERSGMGKP